MINKTTYLKYKRNNQELKIKKAMVNAKGVSKYNEKVEMKTSIEFDQKRGGFKKKISTIDAILVNGDKRECIGSC